VWTELSGALAVPSCELTNVLIYVEGPPAVSVALFASAKFLAARAC